MKKIINFFLMSVLLFQLHALDFNGMWSCVGISPKGQSKEQYKYSWGTVQEPCGIGFSIDLESNKIHTNNVWSFLIDFKYNDDTKSFSFINPLSKEEETYYITEISDYEILLQTVLPRDSLINASPLGSEKKVHYFKIAGPDNANVLKTPVKAILLSDIDLKIKDYQGKLYDFGPVKKNTIVEVINYKEGYIPEITDLDFVFHILVNPELGGYVDPKKIEFLDDITLNGYGGKRENVSSLSVE
ncbi:MAG: hypothetical protein ACI4LS_09850 [Treponema sp.]